MEHTGFFQVRENRCRNELIWKTLWLLPTTTQLTTRIRETQPRAMKTLGPRAVMNPSVLFVGVG